MYRMVIQAVLEEISCSQHFCVTAADGATDKKLELIPQISHPVVVVHRC